MRGVIPDVDILAEECGADPLIEKRSLVQNRHAAVVPEHEANNVEDSGRFKNDRVLPRRNLPRMGRLDGLLRSRLRQPRGIEVTRVSYTHLRAHETRHD